MYILRSSIKLYIVIIFVLVLLSSFIQKGHTQEGFCKGDEAPMCEEAYERARADPSGLRTACPYPCLKQWDERRSRWKCNTPLNTACINFKSRATCQSVGCNWVTAECTTNQQCSSGQICDTNSYKCIRWPPQPATNVCRFNSECITGECNEGQCGCFLPNAPCPAGMRCRSDRICVPVNAPDGTPCTRDGQCTNACIDNVCQQRRKWGMACQNNADCLSRACQSGICLCNQHTQCPNSWWACSSPLEGVPNGNWHCYYQGRPVW